MTHEQLLWIGTQGQMEEELAPRHGLRLAVIPGGPIAGVPRRDQLRNGVKLVMGMATAWRILGAFRPHVLLLTGGYVNAPVALAARLRRIPIAIYLPDIEPGSAIKRLAPLAQRIACTAEESAAYLPPHKLVVTGYPVRTALREALQISPAEARARFDLDPQRFTVFVFGGSRGARSINRALTAALPELLPLMQIVHVSGTLTWSEVEAAAAGLPAELRARYRPFPYLHEEMGAAFRAADLIVARAGASMLGESPAFGAPAVLVPYPHAWRYQRVNADYLAARGAAVRIDDADLEAQLPAVLRALGEDTERLQQMGRVARALDKPDAADRIAAVLIDLATHGGIKTT